MDNSKLLEVLRIFSGKELDKLISFVKSEYFNHTYNADRYIVLLSFILENNFRNERSAKAITKENAYAAIFPGEDFKKGRLEKIMSGLLNLVFEFIPIEFKSKYLSKEINIAHFFRIRENEKMFWHFIQKVKSRLEKEKRLNLHYFQEKQEMEEEIEAFFEVNNTRSDELNLTSTLENLDIYFILKRLIYTVSLLGQKVHIQMNVKPAIKLIERLEPLIKVEDYLQVPILQVYFKAFQVLRSLNEVDLQLYNSYKEILKTHEDQFNEEEIKSLQAILRIYATLQYNHDEISFKRDLFELFRYHLEKGYLLYDGKIFSGTINNVILIGCRCLEFEWIEKFLEDYKEKISGTNFPGQVYRLNKAYIHFYKKEYEGALNLLDDSYEDLYYKILARKLEIMVYFMTDSPLLDARMEAFKILVFRQAKSKLPSASADYFNRFIDILRQIVHPKTFKNPTRLLKILKKVKDNKYVSEREWLIEILEKRLEKLS